MKNEIIFRRFERLKNPVLIIPTSSCQNIYLSGWDRTLEALQRIVDGYIEPCAPVQLRERGIEMLVNEEGILKGLEPNEHLYPFFFLGFAVLVGVEGEDFTGLNRDQFEFAMEWLASLKEY